MTFAADPNAKISGVGKAARQPVRDRELERRHARERKRNHLKLLTTWEQSGPPVPRELWSLIQLPSYIDLLGEPIKPETVDVLDQAEVDLIAEIKAMTAKLDALLAAVNRGSPVRQGREQGQ